MHIKAFQDGELREKFRLSIDNSQAGEKKEQITHKEKPKAGEIEITEKDIYNLLIERITKQKKRIINEEIKEENNYINYVDSLQLFYRKLLLDFFNTNKSNNNQNKKQKKEDSETLHEKISADVFRRLRLRNAQLRELEEQARSYLVNNELNSKTNNSDRDNNSSNFGIRAYHLAVTDLFVEKAIAYLEERANEYKSKGEKMIRRGQYAYIFGAVLAFFNLFPLHIEADNIISAINSCKLPLPIIYNDYKAPQLLDELTEDKKIKKSTKDKQPTKYTNDTIIEEHAIKKEYNTSEFWIAFTKSFSALGMVVLVGVSLIRYGKVLLEQAEQLYERRHALRQGRLFVHLNDGKLTLEEMEATFNWNVSGKNAFSHLPTESQAPWGSVFHQITHKLPEIVKNGLEKLSQKLK